MRAQTVMSKCPEGHDQGSETLRTELSIQPSLKNKRSYENICEEPKEREITSKRRLQRSIES